MKPIAKIICSAIALGWLSSAMAAGVTITEQSGSVVLQSVADASAAAQAASAPVVPADQGAQSAARGPVTPPYEKVDRANIEKRIAERAARTQKRSLEAEKEAAARAAAKAKP